MLTGKHLIAGEWVSSSGDAFQSVNPVDGTLLPTVFHEAGSAEVNRAFASAVDAFNTVRGWKPERFAELLETISSEIMALGDDLLALASAESALPFPRLN